MSESKNIDDETEWEKMNGIIVEGGFNRVIRSEEGGLYYISNREDISVLLTGARVSFLGGYPGNHILIAKNVKKRNEEVYGVPEAAFKVKTHSNQLKIVKPKK